MVTENVNIEERNKDGRLWKLEASGTFLVKFILIG